MAKPPQLKTEAFVKWFRAATPYIHRWGGATFVIAFGGEVLADGEFQQLTHDINVLVSLEVRVVLVHGTRPQIEEQMRQHGVTPHYVAGRRVTDDKALEDVATAIAIALKADKLIFLTEGQGALDARGRLVSELTVKQAEEILAQNHLPLDIQLYLPCAVRATRQDVKRAHLISRHADGAL